MFCEKCTCDLGQKFMKKLQEQRLLQFLLKLNDKYSAVRGHIMMMNPLPTVSQAYRLVAQEENHKEISQISLNTESLAFAAERKNYGSFNNQRPFAQNFQNTGTYNQKPVGSYNPRPTFSQNIGPKRPSKPGANYFCTHCKVQGHNIDRCFQIHGFPPGFKGFKDRKVGATAATIVSQSNDQNSQNVQVQVASTNDIQHESGQHGSLTDEQYSQLLELLNKQFPSTTQNDDVSGHGLLAGNICLLSSSKSNWIVDSGATDHICPNLDIIVDYTAVNDSEMHITIPDGRNIPVLHKGTVVLNDKITLRDVLHVPDFHFFLISVSKLCNDLNCQVIFSDKKCALQVHSQKEPVMLLGDLSDGLYTVSANKILDAFPSQKSVCNTSLSQSLDSAKLWHMRLGHLPFSQLKILKPDCNNSSTVVCQICPAARQC